MVFGLFILFIVTMAAGSAWLIKRNRVVFGKLHTIESKILNEKRKIWVYAPPGINKRENKSRRYPVIYLLDGDANFSWINKAALQLFGVSGMKVCRDMIVVAIANTDRIRDFTPTNCRSGPDGNPVESFKTSGGGERFADFIKDELMSFINSFYPTNNYKAIFGHSLGGLAVMNIMINRPAMFDAYVAIEPSMWWDEKKLLKHAQNVLKQHTLSTKTLYLGIANTMPAGINLQHVRLDTSGATAHMRSVLELADTLEANAGNGLKYTSKYYSDCDHGSVIHKARYDALGFLFGFGDNDSFANGANKLR